MLKQNRLWLMWVGALLMSVQATGWAVTPTGPITVTNVVAKQEGNWLVVNYDLANPGDGEIWIELEFAANGSDYTVVSPDSERLDGDHGIVAPGTSKEIRWQAAAALAGQQSSSAKMRVKADFRFIGVAGHPGVILDQRSGLMWTQDSNLAKGSDADDPFADDGKRTFTEAAAWVAAMNGGTGTNFGYSDWRLPTIAEFKTLPSHSESSGNEPSGHPFTKYEAVDSGDSRSGVHYSWTSKPYNSTHGYYMKYPLHGRDLSHTSSSFIWTVRTP